jgi:hypothetical protein
MQPHEPSSFLIILTIAAAAPFLCEWGPHVRLLLVVLEIGLGILVSPQVLRWAETGPTASHYRGPLLSSVARGQPQPLCSARKASRPALAPSINKLSDFRVRIDRHLLLSILQARSEKPESNWSQPCGPPGAGICPARRLSFESVPYKPGRRW